MFSELKYTTAYSQYFVMGIIKKCKCKDSRVRWWIIEENVAGVLPETRLEHSAVVIADGILLDAKGVFRWEGEIKSSYKSLEKAYEGTVEQFKSSLRKLECAYGDSGEKKQIENIMEQHRPLVRLCTPVGERVYSIERWSYKRGIIQIREVYMLNEMDIYTYNGVLLTMPVTVFKQHYKCNVGWREVKEDVKSKKRVIDL